MSSFNQVTILGYLGKDPHILSKEPNYFVRLSIATNHQYKTKEGKLVENTQWHTVYLNNNVAKWAASAFKKGDKVFISGELRNDHWQGKDGQSHYSSAIHAKDIQRLSMKPQENACSDGSLEEESIDEQTMQIETPYVKAKQEIDQALGR